VVVGAIVAVAGETARDCKVASLTVSVAEGVKVPTLVVIMAVPAPMPLKLPGAEPKGTATVGSEADQFVARLLTSRVLPSLNVPITENVNCVRFARIGLDGKIATETRFDKSTVSVGRVVGGGAPPNEAAKVYVPTLVPIARPVLVMSSGEAFHEVRLVTSCVEPSLKVAVAVSCC
jgi:hypothetical protein